MALRRAASLLVVALLVTACGGEAEGGGPTTLPEDPYSLPAADLDDYEAILAGLRGTPVLVNIWASWCPPCRDEAPLLADAHERYGDRVSFIGVDILDERSAARAFMREYGWTYPSLFDLHAEIRDGLGLLGQPVTLFYDASGELVETWQGPLTPEALERNLERIAGS